MSFYTIEDALSKGLIPESYRDVFTPLFSCECGHAIIINTNRTIMKCSNPKCRKILTRRVLPLYTKLGAQGMGPVNCYEWLRNNNITTLPEALVFAPPSLLGAVNEWLEKPHYAGEVLAMLNLPRLKSDCDKVFTGIKDLAMLKEFVNLHGGMRYANKYGMKRLTETLWDIMQQCEKIEYDFSKFKQILNAEAFPIPIQENTWDEYRQEVFELGLKSFLQRQISGSGLAAENVYDTMILYWDEIEKIFSIVKCLPVNFVTEKIIITGDITLVTKPNGEGYERLEFIDYANSIAINIGKRFVNSTAFVASRWVIADYPSNTNKYREAVARGKLINSKDFIDLLIKETEAENE